MKDIIYFDKQLANSYLAQIDEGVLIKAVAGSKNLQSNQNSSSDSSKKTGGAGAGIPAVVKVDAKYEKTITEMEAAVFSKENNELIETALDDYTLDLLLNKLTNSGKLISNDVSTYADGSLIKINSPLKIFDLHHLFNVTQPNIISLMNIEDLALEEKKQKLKKILSNKNNLTKNEKVINELREEIREKDNYGALNQFAEFTKELLPNSSLMKIDNTISICSTDNIRMNSAMLSLLNSSKRTSTLIGIVISKKEANSFDIEGQLTSTQIAEQATNIFLDIVLTNFELMDIGDYFVRPIAIYYEME